MCMGAREPPEEREVEQFFQHFVRLVQFIFNDTQSVFPPVPFSRPIYLFVSGHTRKCTEVFACQ